MIKAVIVFIILFTMDNLMVLFLPIRPVFGDYNVVPYSLLIGVCMYTFYGKKNHALWLAFVFGLFYDMYGTNLLGLYATMFPIIVFLIKKHLVPITPVNFVSIFYVTTIAILAIETIIYLLVWVITPRSMSLFGFVQHRLIITLIFNILLLAILYLPLIIILRSKEEKGVKTIMMDNTSA